MLFGMMVDYVEFVVVWVVEIGVVIVVVIVWFQVWWFFVGVVLLQCECVVVIDVCVGWCIECNCMVVVWCWWVIVEWFVEEEQWLFGVGWYLV